jgi:hypothetical protein
MQAVQLLNSTVSSLTSFVFVPLGRTPPYLDPQSQEALSEVDVGGMPLDIYFNRIERRKKDVEISARRTVRTKRAP